MKKTFFLLAALAFAAVSMAQTPTVSTSKVSLTYCKTTYGERNVHTNELVDGFTFSEAGDFMRLLSTPNVNGCDSMVTYHVSAAPQAVNMLPGKFNVNAEGKQVQFAMGNLMYRATSNSTTYYPEDLNELKHEVAGGGYRQGIWKFHDEQYEYVADDAVYKYNIQLDQKQDQWVDMFIWASSGVDDDVAPYEMYKNATVTDLAETNYDWGVYNAIENGGNVPGLWRTLTKDEWDYLFTHHTCAVGIIDNKYSGVFVLPDNWETPYDSFGLTNQSTGNTFTIEQWEKMEAKGALFLSAYKYRTPDSHNFCTGNTESIFWTATQADVSNAYFVNTFGNKMCALTTWDKKTGGYVRLVVDVNEQ